MRLIDADALNYVRVRIAHEDGTIGGYNAVVPSSEIKNAPTIEAVPVRHGKWIDEGQYADYHPHHAWRCSECGEHVIEVDTPWYKYCPHCGADMRGEQDG